MGEFGADGACGSDDNNCVHDCLSFREWIEKEGGR